MEHIKEIQSFMRLAEAQLHEAVKAYDMKQLEMAGNLIQEAEQKGCRIHVTGIGSLRILQAMLHLCSRQPAHRLIFWMVQRRFMEVPVRWPSRMWSSSSAIPGILRN